MIILFIKILMGLGEVKPVGGVIGGCVQCPRTSFQKVGVYVKPNVLYIATANSHTWCDFSWLCNRFSMVAAQRCVRFSEIVIARTISLFIITTVKL